MPFLGRPRHFILADPAPHRYMEAMDTSHFHLVVGKYLFTATARDVTTTTELFRFTSTLPVTRVMSIISIASIVRIGGRLSVDATPHVFPYYQLPRMSSTPSMKKSAIVSMTSSKWRPRKQLLAHYANNLTLDHPASRLMVFHLIAKYTLLLHVKNRISLRHKQNMAPR
jgi:hypothetical protein